MGHKWSQRRKNGLGDGSPLDCERTGRRGQKTDGVEHHGVVGLVLPRPRYVSSIEWNHRTFLDEPPGVFE